MLTRGLFDINNGTGPRLDKKVTEKVITEGLPGMREAVGDTVTSTELILGIDSIDACTSAGEELTVNGTIE